jgi:hypothetical protein
MYIYYKKQSTLNQEWISGTRHRRKPIKECIQKDQVSKSYGAWFGRLLCVALTLATTRQSAKQRVVGLSSCRPVANDVRQTARCRSACCHIVARFKSKDWLISQATGRHRDNEPFVVLRWRQNDNATTPSLALCRVVASDKTKRR